MGVTSMIIGLLVTTPPDYQHLLDQFLAERDIPGISAVVMQRDSVLFSGGSGLADIEARRRMTADSVLYAGSLTKVMTAVLALRLVAAGSLSLDDVAFEVTGADHASISVLHLLTHTSGLAREGEFGYWYSADFPDATALAAYLVNAELRSLPGAKTRYSNIGFAALGAVIEQSTGQTFGDALRARVLLPLGMRFSGAPGPAPDVSRGYTPAGRLLPNDERPFAGVGRRIGSRHLREYHDAKAMTPAFGAYTSASDLGRLIQLLLGYGPQDLLRDDLRRRMLTAQGSGRGIGLRISRLNDHAVARHDGWFAAHRSHLLLDLDAGIGAAVLANSDDAAPALLAEALVAATLGLGTDSR